MFIQSEILITDLCTPQSPSQYLAQVLVSETTIKLIVENFKGIFLNTAKKIMFDSINFGSYVHVNND